MPLYEYHCSNCKSKFELLVSHEHADDVVCTKCHSQKVRRLLSVFATHFGDSAETSFDDMPAMGGCGCGDGSCGCN
ncbi:MAG: zinc ribbon domain-containing protein [Chloroflexota bacterium]|nr:zinc ribbon domain-containing protein [Chloroflexota bacterium]MDQ2904684.1 zinc ribbon domain-containing protein [Chloroflexota bacterium]